MGYKLALLTFSLMLVVSVAPEAVGEKLFDKDEIHAPDVVFIGMGTKLFFTLRSKYGWEVGANYCHNRRLIPASIENEGDHILVANFLNDNPFLEANASLWLFGTDYAAEGQFQWMHNQNDFPFSNWKDGSAPINRSRNCVILNSNGYWVDETCSTVSHYILCEAPLLNVYGSIVSDNFIKIAQNNPTTRPNVSPRLTEIGSVGNKIYYKDDSGEHLHLANIMDLCHESGMRMVAPEKADELAFLLNYTEPMENYLLAGSDMLSMSCLKSNTEFRWFYTGNTVANQSSLTGNNHWYTCLLTTNSGLATPDCIGVLSKALCELQTDTGPEICPPGELFWPHEDCQLYYICEDPPSLRSCPDGLYWNQQLMACDFPENVPICGLP